jgi:hypothetical protein
MSISRGQMNRQLYGLGSYFPPENGREKFGLGSKFKKFVRKIIPNEVAEVATKAAPFVAPFNPLLAAGMAGIGGFDQTGSISKSLKSGLLTYGGGQAARYLGGAGFQKGINPFAGADFSGGLMSGIRSLGSSPIGTETGFGKMFAKTPTQEITTVSGGDYGQFVEPPFGSGDALGGEMLTSKPLETATQQITKQGTQGYTDLFKQVLGGDLQQKTQALKDLGGKALKDIYTKPIPGSPGETQIDKLAIGATIAGATSYIEAKKLAEEAELVDDADEYTEEMYEADKARYTDYYSQILTPEAFGLKDGGRVNYSIGSPEPDEDMRNDKDIGIPSIMLDETTDQPEDMESILNDKLSYYIPGFSSKDLSRLYRVLGKEGGKNVDFKNLHKVLSNPNDYPDAIIEIKQMLGIPENKKDGGIMGGRIGFNQGSLGGKTLFGDIAEMDIGEEIKSTGKGFIDLFSPSKIMEILNQAGEGFKQIYFNLKSDSEKEDLLKKIMGDGYENKKDGGIMGVRNKYAMGSEVPIRENQAGIKEMDFRETGGFVPPIGVKERADDIPAMLSNNEFVFTADAVRAAGGGSVNKGAQRMYNMMKSLEGKVV